MSGRPTNTIRKPRGPGFTLMELMTVVAIIGLLVTILMPTMLQVRRSFRAAKSQTIINNIQNACLEYHSDLGVYPADGDGLVQALTGRDNNDGKEGLGFRLVDRGKVYGPYGGTERLATDTVDGIDMFLDAFDRPILYYRCTVTPNGSGGQDYSYPDSLPGQPSNLSDYLKGPGGKYYRTDFVIISPGPNGKWQPFYDIGNSTWNPDSDDIANYKSQQ